MINYHTVDVGGREVFYREGGDPTQPTLLLLHGYPSSSAQYDELMRLLGERVHTVAPDYPGFGRSPALPQGTTFDAIADVIESFTEQIGLTRFSLYVFDFGAPIGYRLATRHPERIEKLIAQNGNAYEAGLGPKMQALKPYWADRQGHEEEVRPSTKLEITRSQYLDGVPDPTIVNPDRWELDQHYLDRPGSEQVMLDLLYDYRNNVTSYPDWQDYLRSHQPPALLPWGRYDEFFPAAGADAYRADLPDAEIHLLDTGHFATATHAREIAELTAEFLNR